MDPGLFVFLPSGASGHRAATLRMQRRSLTRCREAAPVLAGGEPRIQADVAQTAERESATFEAVGSMPTVRSISGVPLHHRLRARRGNGEGGMCTGSRPMCSEGTWSAC